MMRYISLILVLLRLNIACSRRMENRHWYKRLLRCENAWVYFKLENQIRGQILSHAKGTCDYFEISSNTIILISSGDTIRELELPCYSEVFQKSDSVLVTPISKVDSAGGIGDNKYDCKVRKTCFAHLSKIQ
jgi:hypothetical protein